MQSFYPIQITDLRFQIDHITLKKIQFFQNISEAPDNGRLFVILIRHRQFQMVSGGIKIFEVKVI